MTLVNILKAQGIPPHIGRAIAMGGTSALTGAAVSAAMNAGKPTTEQVVEQAIQEALTRQNQQQYY